MVVKRERRLLSVDDYERIIETGILTENDKVELIHGEIVYKTPKGDPHLACLKRLIHFVLFRFADRTQFCVQNPVRLADSEPEPDAKLLQPRSDYYASVSVSDLF